MSLYDDLGVAKDASADDIKSAYRKAANKAHPDRAGGSVVQFQKIQKAHDILMDEDARKRYDEFGTTDKIPDLRGLAMEQLCKIIINKVQQAGEAIDYTDILSKAREDINAGMTQGQQQLAQHPRAVWQLERALARLKKKKKGSDFLRNALEMTLTQTKAGKANLEAHIKMGTEMLLLLDEYKYDVAQPDPMSLLQQLQGGYTVFSTSTTTR